MSDIRNQEIKERLIKNLTKIREEYGSRVCKEEVYNLIDECISEAGDIK